MVNDDERLALAACALLVACGDDNLRDLSADERAVALRGRRNAHQMLLATKISPTDLKALGLRLCQGIAPA
jgi:hypothetical protein